MLEAEKERERSTSTTWVSSSMVHLPRLIYLNLIGYLYPDRDRELTEADSFDKLKEAVRASPYEYMISQVTDIPSREKASEFSSAGKSIGKINYIALIL